jgi:hypothetical protein
MNKQLRDFAKNTLKEGLAQLPNGHQLKFKGMYAHGNLEADMNTVVDNMPDEKLDWAMEQVQRSLEKLKHP